MLTKNRNGHSVGNLDSTVEIILKTQINDEAEVNKPAHGMEHNLSPGAGDVEGDRLEEDQDTEGIHGCEHVGRGVRMPELKGLYEAEHHHHVHHARIELEAHIGRADVECGAEHALEDHADAQGVEDAVLLDQARVIVMVHIRLVISG